jgi:hypothetical protein
MRGGMSEEGVMEVAKLDSELQSLLEVRQLRRTSLHVDSGVSIIPLFLPYYTA